MAVEVNTNCNMLSYSKNWHLSTHTSPSLESLANLHFQCSEGPRSKTSSHQYSYWSPHQEWCGPKHHPLQTNFTLLYMRSWWQWSDHAHTKPFGFKWTVNTTNNHYLSGKQKLVTVISGFLHDVGETYTLLGYYTASCGNPLPTFWDNISPVIKGQEFQEKKNDFLTSEDGTNTLSSTVGKRLPHNPA